MNRKDIAMITTIDKSKDVNEAKTLIESVHEQKKGIDLSKFVGKIKIDEDPLAIQKKMRNEWDWYFIRYQYYLVSSQWRTYLQDLLTGKRLFVSFVSEIETLGYKGISDESKTVIRQFLNECVIIDLNALTKNIVIDLKQVYNIKIPDAIVMATSLYLNIPLITADADFKKVDQISLIYYER